MGICKSVEIELPESWLELFAALKIAPLHVKQLLDVFHKMDIDESGSVDVVKLLKFLKVECTPFVERAFSMFDGDESGKVDFREFVLCLWDFCTTSLVSIDTFTFCLYEDSRVGFLTSGEVGEMLKDIYGKARLHEAPVKL